MQWRYAGDVLRYLAKKTSLECLKMNSKRKGHNTLVKKFEKQEATTKSMRATY